MATWARRLSSAQQKEGTTRKGGVDLPDELPADLHPDDHAALRSLAAVARDREGFATSLTVRVGAAGDELLEVTVAHGPDGAVFTIEGEATAPVTAAEPADGDTAGDDDLGEPQGGGPLEGDRVMEMLTDALVITADPVAIFASVGAEALWANDAFATTIPIREADKVWLIELLDEWSKGHFEVNVLPSLVQHGRWHGKLVLQPHADDVAVPVLTSIVAHRDGSGEIEAVTMHARDLRNLWESEERHRASDSPLAGLVEQASDIIIVVTSVGEVRYASPASTRILGLDDGALDGTNLLDRVRAEDRDKLDFRLLAEPDEDGIPPSIELHLRTVDDRWRIVEVVAADLSDNAVIAGVVLTARDVTDRIEAVQRLADRAYTDPLTLLPNRMRLLDRLGKALADASEASVVAMLFDVDGFKKFNERWGHAAGDELLRQVAHRLSEDVRPQDFVARLGGNEFAMVMRNLSDVDQAVVAADRIKTALSEPYRVGAESVEITVSVGLGVSHEGQGADELLADADGAVGIGKDAGGDRVEVMTAELRNSATRRRSIEQLLRKAITEGDGVEVHYQPVIDLETGKITAAEALLRVHDDEGALLNPASFLEAAEDSGLISPLGAQVLMLTCRQLKQWNDDLDAAVPKQISVNVSPRQLEDPAFPQLVGDAIEDAGITPDRLWLEITESMMIGEKGIIDETVAAVRAMGVVIGLDDFGAGQSSLGYLKRFPLDFVKIDKELIQGLGQSEQDMAIVRATVDLAHSLHLEVVAVGVETEEQLEICELLGVDRVQGFYYMPAVPASEIAERVKQELGT